jgi:hypothetical protein
LDWERFSSPRPAWQPLPFPSATWERVEKRGSAKMFRRPYLLGLIALSLIVLQSCGPSNTNNPDYIKDLAIYREGEGGIFIYLVLADKAGQPTASKGRLYYAISYDNRVLESMVVKVNTSDFKKTEVGMGPYKRETILLPIGRFTYNELLYSSPDKSINLKGKEGTIRLNFVWGEAALKRYKGNYGRDDQIIGKKDEVADFAFAGSRMAVMSFALDALRNDRAPDSGVLHTKKPFTF